MNTVSVAKFNMIEQQLRPWEVLDRNVLSVIGQLDREDFVPEIYKGLAYADCQIPLANAATMFPPIVEGRMLQALLINADDHILEIGTGSGYITACLATLGKRVLSLDIDTASQQTAAAILQSKLLNNVEFETKNAFECNYNKAFNVIAVTGSVKSIPENLKKALIVGGRLFVIVGESPAMQALLITRASTKEWITESLFETDLPALMI
ncbi:MAG: protein-L-isoaspartate(D-aspartate) O-methyltransferase [Candidatus Azotimanducaceae bacterium]|jgi:protein-L-isoaspartate(D-aspartate) O-methyltransferase